MDLNEALSYGSEHIIPAKGARCPEGWAKCVVCHVGDHVDFETYYYVSPYLLEKIRNASISSDTGRS